MLIRLHPLMWESYRLSHSEGVLLAVLNLLILKIAELFFSFWWASQNSPKCRVLIDCKENVVEHGTKWENNSLHPTVKLGLYFVLLKLLFFLSLPSVLPFLSSFSPPFSLSCFSQPVIFTNVHLWYCLEMSENGNVGLNFFFLPLFDFKDLFVAFESF